jgi:hypothetical protein
LHLPKFQDGLESAIDHAKQYELEVLDNLILDEINPTGSEFIFTNEKAGQWIAIAKIQKGKIQRGIICTTLCINTEKKKRAYIQNIQFHLNFLVNTSCGYFNNKIIKDHPERLVSYEIIRECLNSLLDFLSTRFHVYFDFHAEANISYKQRTSELFDSRLQNIISRQKVEKIELLDIALKPVKEYLEYYSTEDVTYNAIIYLEALVKEIEKLINSNKNFEEQLKFALICLNFNSYRFFAYLTGQIKQDTVDIINHSGKVEVLSRYLKMINQIHEYPELVLYPKQKPIKEQISVWIIEEIEHLERSLKLKHNSEIKNFQSETTELKLQTDMSVAQLAYLIRTMIEVGIIKNTNQRDVLKLISGMVKTKQTDTISPESLRTRFYNIEDNTKLAVKDLVINMLNFVNKKT